MEKPSLSTPSLEHNTVEFRKWVIIVLEWSKVADLVVVSKFDPNFFEDRILLMNLEIIDNHASRVRSFDLSGLRPSIVSELVKAPQGVGWQLSSRVRRPQSLRLRSIRRNINRHYQHNCPHFCIEIDAWISDFHSLL